MFKKILVSAGLVTLLAAPVMAEDMTCAAMLEKADKAAAEAKLDEAAGKALADMKAKAEEQAKAGDEAGCKATAAEMLKALGAE